MLKIAWNPMTASAPACSIHPVGAIILSAGRSERMGTPKALLRFGQETALARMLRVLREAGIDQIILVLNRESAQIERACGLHELHNRERLTTVIHPAPERGQTSSIRIGACNLSPGYRSFLLCPVDQPLFEPEDLGELLGALEQAPAGISIVAPSFEQRRGHPVLFRQELAAEFQALDDDTPAHSVIRRDPGRVLHWITHNPELITNLNTPESYEQALRRRS